MDGREFLYFDQTSGAHILGQAEVPLFVPDSFYRIGKLFSKLGRSVSGLLHCSLSKVFKGGNSVEPVSGDGCRRRKSRLTESRLFLKK